MRLGGEFQLAALDAIRKGHEPPAKKIRRRSTAPGKKAAVLFVGVAHDVEIQETGPPKEKRRRRRILGAGTERDVQEGHAGEGGQRGRHGVLQQRRERLRLFRSRTQQIAAELRADEHADRVQLGGGLWESRSLTVSTVVIVIITVVSCGGPPLLSWWSTRTNSDLWSSLRRPARGRARPRTTSSPHYSLAMICVPGGLPRHELLRP